MGRVLGPNQISTRRVMQGCHGSISSVIVCYCIRRTCLLLEVITEGSPCPVSPDRVIAQTAICRQLIVHARDVRVNCHTSAFHLHPVTLLWLHVMSTAPPRTPPSHAEGARSHELADGCWPAGGRPTHLAAVQRACPCMPMLLCFSVCLFACFVALSLGVSSNLDLFAHEVPPRGSSQGVDSFDWAINTPEGVYAAQTTCIPLKSTTILNW